MTPPLVSRPSDSGVTSRRSTLLDVAGQDRPLDRRADGDDLVGIDPLVRLLAEDLLDDLLDARHAGRAADQDDLVDVGRLELGVFHGLQDRPAAAFEEVIGQLLELGAADRHRDRCLGPDWSAVMNGRLMSAWAWNDKVLLGLLGRFLEPLQEPSESLRRSMPCSFLNSSAM